MIEIITGEKGIHMNVSFSGQLYLKNPELWTDKMKEAIANNKNIQAKLQHHDIIGEISTKKETKVPPFSSHHYIGDTLYKVSLVVSDSKPSLLQRVKNFLHGYSNEYIINKHYHSELTTIDRIKKMKME